MGLIEAGMLANLVLAFTAMTVWATRPVPVAERSTRTRSDIARSTR